MLCSQLVHSNAFRVSSDTRGCSVVHKGHCRASRAAAKHRIACNSAKTQSHGSQHDAGLSRRDALLSALLLAPCLQPSLAHAEQAGKAVGGSTYNDSIDKFSINIPDGWEFVETSMAPVSKYAAAVGQRRVLVWWPSSRDAADVNVTAVVTNVGADFTALGSFGSAADFGANLVNSMDRSYLLRTPEWLRPKEPIQLARLVDARNIGSGSDMYFIEYTVEQPPQPQRHLYSTVSLAFNGRYNRLYTITAQCLETEAPQLQRALVAAVQSFKPPRL